ncbi:MAG TPA: hypothetical protein DGG95_14860 [Cytophagales bacterium]|jgi:hypothetical protein|nr:hypothetical protein [Cytophagales bacterium]
MSAKYNLNYQLGLLHFAHLLVTVDGFIDEREKKAIRDLQREENISDEIIHQFDKTVATKSERDIFLKGVDLLSSCSEQEKLCALVHLYRMAEADDELHVKEVRLLLYSLKSTKVEFDDVILTARMVAAGKKCVSTSKV